MQFDPLFIGLAFVAILLAFAVHEWAHGLMAYQLGDPTPKYEGRLTPNPIVHLDPFGAAVMGITMVMSGGKLVMGWAKPVQFDPNNLKNEIFDGGVIALAGPLSNFVLAFLCGLPLLLGAVTGGVLQLALFLLVSANLGMGLFNCIPIPPLDGWKIVQIVLPSELAWKMQTAEAKAGMWPLFALLLVFFVAGDLFLKPLFATLLYLFTGIQ